MTCDGDHLDVPNPDVPLLQLENCEDANDMNMQSKRLAQRMITGDYYDPPEAPRLHINYCQKSYQLPTIASRMKQVTKIDFYYSRFNSFIYVLMS